MRRIVFQLAPAVLASGFTAIADTASEAPGSSDRVEKISRQMVWEPGPEGTQLPLWPADLAIQPSELDKPEEIELDGTGEAAACGMR